MMRLNKCYGMIEKILQNFSSSGLSEEKIESLVEKIISMGIIQLIYKNCNK